MRRNLVSMISIVLCLALLSEGPVSRASAQEIFPISEESHYQQDEVEIYDDNEELIDTPGEPDAIEEEPVSIEPEQLGDYVLDDSHGEEILGESTTFSYKPYASATYELLYVIENGNTIKITGVSGEKSGTLLLPSSINGKTVTTIGRYAFDGCNGFTGDLIIPNSVVTVDFCAFHECSGFSGNLTIPDSVITIGGFAFDGCNGFTGDLIIPNSVTTMGNCVFRGCSGFSGNLRISDNVTVIPVSAFNGCDGFAGDLILPEGLTTIEDGAFSGCTCFHGSLSIPDSVRTIENGAFCGCKGFSGTLTIPSGATYIDTDAFYGCDGITKVVNNCSLSWTLPYVVDKFWIDQSTSCPLETYSYLYQLIPPYSVAVRNDYQGEPVNISGFDSGNDVTYQWNINCLLTNQSEIDKNEVLTALALSRAAERSADEVDDILLQTGLVEEVNDWSRWSYAYDSNGVAHTISLRQYGGCNIITVAIRGSHTFEDWIRVNAFPAGFAETAAHITDDMKQFLRDRNIEWGDKNNRFFITGHSMGGAVAGDIAKRIESHDGIDMSQITCYTFATPPNVYDIVDYSVNHNPWYYIHNILNEYDLIPHLAQIGTVPETRWGNDYWIGSNVSETAVWYEYLTGKDYHPYEAFQVHTIDNHLLECYLAILLTEDAYTIRVNDKSRVAIVRCPVDVEVLDANGVCVGRTVNNIEQATTDENVILFVNGDEKYVILPGGEDYSLRLTGNGTGTMRYDLSDIMWDQNGNVEYEAKTFEDVELKSGKQMICDLADVISSSDAQLFVTDNKGDINKEVLEDGTEEEIYNGFYIKGLDTQGYVYTGSAIKPAIRVYDRENLLKEKTDYTISYTQNTNAGGNALITVIGRGNYSGTEKQTFTIKQKNIGDPDVIAAEIPSSKYNKRAQTPVPKLTYGRLILVKGRDFDVAYYKDEDCAGETVTPNAPGLYYVLVSGKGNYTGNVKLPFVIAADEEVPVSKLTITKIADQPFDDGRQICPPLVIKDGRTDLVRGVNYEVVYRNNIDIGTASAVITGLGKYVGTRTVMFKIYGTSLKRVTVKGVPASVPFTTGQEIKPTITLYDAARKRDLRGIALEEYDAMATPGERLAYDYTYEFKNNIEIGTATVLFTGVNGYSDQVKKTFRITGTALSSARLEGFVASFVYTGEPIEQAIELTMRGRANLRKISRSAYEKLDRAGKLGYDCTIEYANNKEIGTATMTVTGVNGFIGKLTRTFKITGTAISTAKIGGEFVSSFVYDGSGKQQNGVKLYSKVKDKPSDLMTGALRSEYDGMNERRRSQIDYVISYEKNVNVGTATMVLTGVNKWYGTTKKTFRITPYDINRNEGAKQIRITLDPVTYQYAKAGVKPKPAVLFGDTLLKEGVDYTLSYLNNTRVNDGTGTNKPTIKVTGKGNFTKTNDKTTFAIAAANMRDAGLKITTGNVIWANRAGNWKTTVSVVDPDGRKLAVNTDYTVRFARDAAGLETLNDKSSVAAGSDVYVFVQAKPGSAYEGDLTGSYHIYRYDMSRLTATIAPKTYTGKRVRLSPADITWKSGGKVVDDVTFTIDEKTYLNNVKKGTASVVVTGTGDCAGSKKVTFTIGAKSIFWWWRSLIGG